MWRNWRRTKSSLMLCHFDNGLLNRIQTFKWKKLRLEREVLIWMQCLLWIQKRGFLIRKLEMRVGLWCQCLIVCFSHFNALVTFRCLCWFHAIIHLVCWYEWMMVSLESPFPMLIIRSSVTIEWNVAYWNLYSDCSICSLILWMENYLEKYPWLMLVVKRILWRKYAIGNTCLLITKIYIYIYIYWQRRYKNRYFFFLFKIV